MIKSSKKALYVREMFSSISHRYDLLNKLLSLGRDRYWRSFAVSQLSSMAGGLYLDIATGTADVAMEIAKRGAVNTGIVGVDFNEKMLEIGRRKIKKSGFEDRIKLNFADAQTLPFRDEFFDAAIVAFGIRNLSDPMTGIKEMRRVVKEKGKVVILEFTTPGNSISREIYYLYFRRLLPLIGGIISGKRHAYQYLSESVIEFPDQEGLKRMMEDAGLHDVRYYNLTFGIVAVHVGVK
ncbi:MAG: bifunctional demethylmenaquinone methyltransferase/2-methoxy-6-polyprenyl-1,4-benzoquinol methylase UbiE [Nitrospinota bacterium]